MLGRREQALTMLDSLSVLLRYNLADAQMPALGEGWELQRNT
ncbi:MAG: hypothetical protein ACLTBV_32065 [Enterocloster bolteae]